MQQATIKIKNLRLRTVIGINPEEKKDKQDLVINAVINYECEDFVTDSLNYRTITKRFIKQVEQQSYDLLEELAQSLMNIVFEFKQVTSASIEIDKPHALRFSDSVSITLRQAK